MGGEFCDISDRKFISLVDGFGYILVFREMKKNVLIYLFFGSYVHRAMPMRGVRYWMIKVSHWWEQMYIGLERR